MNPSSLIPLKRGGGCAWLLAAVVAMSAPVHAQNLLEGKPVLVTADKAADTKGGPGGMSNVSGNVIGVGSNPIVNELKEQQGIAREQLTCLQILAQRLGYQSSVLDVTASGATPHTPANASPNKSPTVTKNK